MPPGDERIDRLSNEARRWRPILAILLTMATMVGSAATVSVRWLDSRNSMHIRASADSLKAQLYAKIDTVNLSVGLVRCGVLRLHGEGGVLCDPHDLMGGGVR